MMELIKIFAVSIYYLIYLMFQEWVNVFFVLVLGMVSIAGVCLAMRDRKCSKGTGVYGAIMFVVLYFGMVMQVYQKGGIDNGILLRILRIWYYVCSVFMVLKISNKLWFFLMENSRECATDIPDNILNGVRISLKSIYVIGLIPIILISPYVFAKADDYSFGYHCHRAWVDTGSICSVLGGAVEMVIEAYEDWQGTFSSIFLMSLQPAVFHEKLYCIVPLFFVSIISLSGYFFIKTLLVDVWGMEKRMSSIVWWAYIVLAVQCVPVKQSAMFWYNGATHYMTAYCIMLLMLGFMLRLYIGKRTIGNWLGASIPAFYVGGGNLVSGLGTVIIMGTLLIIIFISKKWKKYKCIWSVCIIFFISFAINVIAPGNFHRKENSVGNGLILSFGLAFKNSLEYMLSGWIHWTIIAFLFVCIPVFWILAQKMKISFKYPGIVTGYSWCYMSGLFFAPLYTINNVHVGRFQNIMFLQWILLIIINAIYWMGWLQRKYSYVVQNGSKLFQKSYFVNLAVFIIISAGVCAVAEPEHYTSVGAAVTLLDENLDEYAADYWYNVELLNSDMDPIVLKDLSNVPEFLEPKESEAWHSGLRLFYRKKLIEMEGEDSFSKD